MQYYVKYYKISKNSCFIEYCEQVEEYRQDGKVRHLLKDVLFIAVAATIGNADSWSQVEAFAETHEEWLRKFLELPYGIPSHDTFERVFDRISLKQFAKAFTVWTNEIADRPEQAIIAIDGKMVRGSFDNQKGKSAIHIVNAWISTNSIILGQLKTSQKSNEITAIPELLEILLIKGCIITIDAMGCQKDIAEKIIQKEADYVITLKGNQPTLFAKAVRSHWGIESTHWILDIVFKEDASRERKNNGPKNKSLLNKVVLNKLKYHKDKKRISNPIKRYKASMNTKYLEEIMFATEIE